MGLLDCLLGKKYILKLRIKIVNLKKTLYNSQQVKLEIKTNHTSHEISC